MIKNNKIKKYFKNLHKDIKKIRSNGIGKFIRKRLKLILILFIVLFLGMGYFIGSLSNSQDKLLVELEVALKEENLSKLKKIVKIDDRKIKSEDLKPLMDYYKENKSRIDNDIRKLKQGCETETFSIEERDVVFKNYYIKLKTYNVRVNSNFDEGRFTIDDEKYIDSGESFENIVPGKYLIKGILYSKYDEINNSEEINILGNDEIKVDFNAINITIESPYKDAKVYINDVDSNLSVDEFKDIGPFNVENSNYIYIEKEFPWGKVQGEKTYIKDIPNVKVDLNINNNEMQSELVELSQKFYTSVFEALNEEDRSYIKGATENAREKIYNILEKSYILLKNKYTIQDITVKEDKNEYSYKYNMYIATIVVKVDYSIEKNIFSLNKSENSKLFFTNIIYKDGNWIVDDVENFTL
ncbi:MAG: hypothetical protein E7214_11860 [Clostridium sp.]|nr:hypothetical protein [Clostridium sp.]